MSRSTASRAIDSRGDLLGSVLQRVSRSFYLSLRILPRDLREPVGLAYLLARAADTVADTRLVPRAERLHHLETFRRAYAGDAVAVSAVAEACVPHQAHDAERILLTRVEDALELVAALPPHDRAEIRAVLDTITSGMSFDLTRFPGETAAELTALDTLGELDHYTYLVAGCVGEFWTALHLAHRPRLAHWDPIAMRARGVRFGKALQITNVLRDVATDLRHGRCYLPAQELEHHGLLPEDLLDPAKTKRARPLVARLIGLALEHYEVAWSYTLAIPRREVRTRWSCAWPLMIGLGTLGKLAEHPDPVAAVSPIKLTRAAVYGILGRSTITIWSNGALRRDAARLRRRIAG